MDPINVNIPDFESQNDFSIIYKGKEDEKKIIEVKTSKEEMIKKLRYFKQRTYEINHLNEYYIHDNFSCEIFKDFIESIKTKSIYLTENNYQDYYQLSCKYEYYELEQVIKKFIEQRPDVSNVIEQLTAKTNTDDESDDTNQFSDPVKEDIISKHLDFCLKNSSMMKLPIKMLNRILNSPTRVLNDHHLLFDFIKKIIHEKYENTNDMTQNDHEDLEFLIGSLDYQEMSNEDLEAFLSEIDLSNIFHPKHATEKIKQLFSEKEEAKKKIMELESKIDEISEKYSKLANSLSTKTIEDKKEINKIQQKIDEQAKTISRSFQIIEKQGQIIENFKNKFSEQDKKIEEQSKTISNYQSKLQEQEKITNAKIQDLEKICKTQQIKIDQQDKLLKDFSEQLEKTREMCEKVVKNQQKVQEGQPNKKIESTQNQQSKIANSKMIFSQEFNRQPFSGIFAKLTSQHNCNINDGKIIEISGNKYEYNDFGSFSSLVDFNYTGHSYESQDKPNSFLCFDFIDHEISLSAYSIKSSNRDNPSYLKSWVLEGSNDKANWIILDSHSDDSILCSHIKVSTFNIKDKSKSEMRFRYIQLRMTGKSSYDDNYLEITNIEFFGNYFHK